MPKLSNLINLRRAPVLGLLFFGAFALLQAQTRPEHWVTTWATAELLLRTAQPQPAPQTAAAQQPPATPPLTSLNNQAVRMVAHISIGGRRVRVRLANAFGNMPVAVGSAHVALRAKGSEIIPASDRPLSFNGKQNCTLLPGAVLVSDPVDLDIPQLSDLAVTLYLPEDTGPLTTHAAGLHTTYISKPAGDHTAPQFSEAGLATTTQSYYWLAGVDVLADSEAATIVTLGDSITDGARSTPDTNHTWPAVLAARLLANPATSKIAVANEGIGGNRILRDGNGVSALARFDRDVISQPGVRWVIILEGINDIGYMTRAQRGTPTPGIVDRGDITVTAGDLIGGLRQMIERAHAQGIKVAGGTITPFEGAAYYSDEGQQIREEVNRWIRTSGAFDAVIDFAAAVQDPSDPKQFRAELQSGDHLHPNDAGYAAMANAVDLSVFAAKTSSSGMKKR